MLITFERTGGVRDAGLSVLVYLNVYDYGQ
jgi:hypothetical protein